MIYNKITTLLLISILNSLFGFSQDNIKVIKEIKYVNGATIEDVEAKIYKVYKNRDDWDKGKRFSRQRPDISNCDKIDKIWIIPTYSVFGKEKLECNEIENTILVKSSREEVSYLESDQSSNFSGDVMKKKVIGFEKDERIDEVIFKILYPVGLASIIENNRIKILAAAVPNAQASIVNGKPYIYYNPDIVDKILVENDWASIGIFSHEIAHFLGFHSMESLAASNLSKETSHKLELESDEWAGWILGYLNTNKKEALKMLKFINYSGETKTHPSKKLRKEAILRGLQNAQMSKINAQINNKFRIYQKKAEIKFINKEYRQAVKLLDTAISYNPVNSQLFSKRAVSRLYSNPDMNLVFSDANKSIQLDSLNTLGLECIAISYLSRYESDFLLDNLLKGKEFLDKLNKTKSESKLTNFIRAEVERIDGKFELSLQYYNKVIESDSLFRLAYHRRARVFGKLERKTEAINDLEFIISKYPKSGIESRLLGDFYYNDGQFLKAIELYNKSIENDSLKPQVFYLRAKSKLQLLGRDLNKLESSDKNEYIESALVDLLKANDIQPNIKVIIYELAFLYFNNGNYIKAEKYFSQLINLEPTALHYQYRANTFFLKRDYNKALNDYNKALENDNNNPYTILGRAYTKLFLEDIEGALKELNYVKTNFIFLKTNCLFGIALNNYVNNKRKTAITQINELKLDTNLGSLTNDLLFRSFANTSDPLALLSYIEGLCYFELDHFGLLLNDYYKEAISSFNQAIEYDNQFVDANAMAMFTLYYRGQYYREQQDDGCKYYEIAKNYYPFEGHAFFTVKEQQKILDRYSKTCN